MSKSEDMYKKLGYMRETGASCFPIWLSNPRKHVDIVMNLSGRITRTGKNGFTKDEIMMLAQLLKDEEEEKTMMTNEIKNMKNRQEFKNNNEYTLYLRDFAAKLMHIAPGRNVDFYHSVNKQCGFSFMPECYDSEMLLKSYLAAALRSFQGQEVSIDQVWEKAMELALKAAESPDSEEF